MPTGVSAVGLQTLITNATAPLQLLALEITSQPLPPARRVGYFYLYQYLPSGSFQCQMVERGIIYAPGIKHKFLPPAPSSSYVYRWDAVWDVGGLNWNAVLA